MARKQRGHDRSSGGNPEPKRAQKSSDKPIVPRSQRQSKAAPSKSPDLSKYLLPSGQVISPPDLRGSAAERSLGALKDMRRFDLSYSEAAKLWHLDTRTFRKYARSGLRTLRSGRIGALAKDRIHFTFQKPTTKVGEYESVETRSSAERQLYAQWRLAVHLIDHPPAGEKSPYYKALDSLPKNISIGGVRLPTGHYEVQKILDALEREGAKFEGPYRVRAVEAA